MKKLIVNGNERLLLDAENDNCPICNTPLNQVYFTWGVFHGEARSSCCKALFQIKDYCIKNPTDEEKELLAALAGDHIEFAIKTE
jgi:hypothetical protein